MKIFDTDRLDVRRLELKDKDYFIELLSKPEIISPIPQIEFSSEKILEIFEKDIALTNVLDNRCACGVFEKAKSELIGLALFLKNDENDFELGYRFRVEYWGKGYGTEIAKGMIDYYFNDLNVQKVAADANVENMGSIKILSKWMNPVRDFYNPQDKCTDRRFSIEKKNWIK